MTSLAATISRVPMREMIGKEGEKRLPKIGMEQMLASMGHQSSGACTLWNYPSWMRNLVAHDINGEDPIDMPALESKKPFLFFLLMYLILT